MRPALVVTAAVLIAVLVVTGSAQEPAMPGDRGVQLFFAHGCHGCHTIGALGTPIAPDLAGIGLAYTEPALAAWLRDPAVQKRAARMPRIELAPAEIDALAAYLASLRRRAS
jgi:mono/diheme cytochrome c family protein